VTTLSTAARKSGRLSREQAGAVRRHLDEILASRSFATCRRAQDFLRLIVEHALAGEFDSLRERAIGMEMFGRPAGYDTANDAVVRVKATEVRKKLAHFYLEAEPRPGVRIELPSGTYIPSFQMERPAKTAAARFEAAPLKSMAPGLGGNGQATALETGTMGGKPPRGGGPRPWLSLRRISYAALAAAAYEIALVYAGSGRKDEAFKWLSESLKAHSHALSHLLVDPGFDSLRSDPRFSSLLRQLSLG